MSRTHVPRLPLRTAVLLVAVSALLLASLALSACGPPASSSGTALSPAVLPGKLDFSSPKAAVLTYLDYTRFAYRVANSDLASAVASPWEDVRVDSYVELNREKDRGIEQRLTKFAERSQSKEGTNVVLATTEEWRYRYFALSSRQYVTPMYTAAYDTTYTLVANPKGGWYVDKVDAKALTTVK